MRKVMIMKDLAYADNKSSAGANTALTPVDLREGAVGIYGISPTSTNNAYKQALIIDGGADAAGKVPDSSFDGDHVVIAVGTSSGAQVSQPIPVPSNGLVKYKAAAYTAPVYQVFGIGYVVDPSTPATVSAGDLNTPVAVSKYDALEIKILDTENSDQGGAIYRDIFNVNTTADDSETDLSMLLKLAALIEADTKYSWVAASVSIADGGGSAFANSATVAAVLGSTSLTTSANHGVGVGDYVSLNGQLFQAQTGTATTTLVLDRAWPFASATIANANARDLGATAPTTNLGLTIVSQVRGRNFSLATGSGSVYEDAEVSYLVSGTKGAGIAADVQADENEARGLKGTADFIHRYMPLDDLKTVSTETYDQYDFVYQLPHQVGTGATAKTAHKLFQHLKVAFPSTDNNGGQAEFEDVLGVLLNGADGLGGI